MLLTRSTCDWAKQLPVITMSVVLAIGLDACGRIPAEDSGTTETVAVAEEPAETHDSSGVQDMGFGYKPARGPVETIPPGAVAVEFEPAEMNFGVLSPGMAVRGTTRLWNVGTEELRISKSITSCGCTAAENLAGRVIPPGGYTEFTTTMNMKSGLGQKKEKITVYFEPDGKRIAIQYYTAELSLPIRLAPPYLNASSRVNDQWVQTTEGEIVLIAQDGRPFSVLRAHGEAPDFVGFDPATDQPRSEYTLRWDLRRFHGVIPWFWVIETDRPDCPLIDATIRHSSTLPPKRPDRPWAPKDQRILVGTVRPGEQFEVVTKIEYGGGYPPDPTTATVVSESTLLQAELIEAQVDGQYLQLRIGLSAPDDAPPGLLYGALAVGASGFTASLPVIGSVEQ